MEWTVREMSKLTGIPVDSLKQYQPHETQVCGAFCKTGDVKDSPMVDKSVTVGGFLGAAFSF